MLSFADGVSELFAARELELLAGGRAVDGGTQDRAFGHPADGICGDEVSLPVLDLDVARVVVQADFGPDDAADRDLALGFLRVGDGDGAVVDADAFARGFGLADEVGRSLEADAAGLGRTDGLGERAVGKRRIGVDRAARARGIERHAGEGVLIANAFPGFVLGADAVLERADGISRLNEVREREKKRGNGQEAAHVRSPPQWRPSWGGSRRSGRPIRPSCSRTRSRR